jgi:glycine dehydrogenase subunit 1
MARAVNGRNRVLVSRLIGPESRSVLETTLRDQPDVGLQTINMANGLTDLNGLSRQIDDDTSAVVVQSPNFLGGIEPLERIAELTHAHKALLIVITDPISAGVLRTVGELGADIAVGEGQALGIPLSLGGPYLGLLACRQEYMRRIPGRLVGQTTDRSGRVGYCLTLQTREQHIRREKATSNVCTNQGLMAVRAAVYMAAMGRQGIRQVASLCLDKAHYAAEQIARLPGFSLAFGAPFFKEFCVRTTRPVTRLLAHARGRGILAGVPVECWFPELKDCFLVAVTEKRTKPEIDQLVSVLGEDVS